jgi:hypothetical protein
MFVFCIVIESTRYLSAECEIPGELEIQRKYIMIKCVMSSVM